MADQSLFQGGQHSETLLAQRREIASDAAESHSDSRRAKTAGDLLLDLHHPDIELREAVVERHGEVVQEQQYRLLVRRQTIEQIAGRRLFAPTPSADLWWRIRRVGLIALSQQGPILRFPVVHLQRSRSPTAKRPPWIDRGPASPHTRFLLASPP